jgi:hypothetical protein
VAWDAPVRFPVLDAIQHRPLSTLRCVYLSPVNIAEMRFGLGWLRFGV